MSAVEPAGAASTAALVGPLRERLRGKREALIICGSNVTPATFARHIAEIPTEFATELATEFAADVATETAEE